MYHVACASSTDLLLTELLLYNACIPVERAFGSVKYAVSSHPLCSRQRSSDSQYPPTQSFLVISTLTAMLVSFLAILIALALYAHRRPAWVRASGSSATAVDDHEPSSLRHKFSQLFHPKQHKHADEVPLQDTQTDNDVERFGLVTQSEFRRSAAYAEEQERRR